MTPSVDCGVLLLASQVAGRMAVYRMFLLHQRGKIQFLYICISRRHVVTRKWLPHIWGSMAETFQRYIIKYSHSVVPGLFLNLVLPARITILRRKRKIRDRETTHSVLSATIKINLQDEQ